MDPVNLSFISSYLAIDLNLDIFQIKSNPAHSIMYASESRLVPIFGAQLSTAGNSSRAASLLMSRSFRLFHLFLLDL